MKTWRSTRLLSLILVLAMLIQMLPPQAFALSSSEDSVIATATEAESQPVVTVLGEVQELREEDTKHFRLSDGSYVAVSYGLPVHYEDEDGQWQDIDNSLSLEASTNTYQLAHADTAVSFNSTLADGTLLTTSKGDVSISMSLLDTEQALQMISGELEATEPAEVPTEETVPADTVPAETAPSETIPSTVPEETEAEIPTDTVPEETAVETEPSETAAAEIVPEAETAAEETMIQEDTPEATSAGEASMLQSDEETIPEQTVAETQDIPEETVPEETTSETIPTETEEATLPEETTVETVSEAPSETTEETMAPDGEISSLTFSRSAAAQVLDEAPAMLSLQENHTWNVEDVIPDNLYSSLVYQDVFPDIDLKYTASGYNVKEQIIVNAAQSSYRYDFLLNLEGLTAEMNEDGSVSFVDSADQAIYKIPIPYMEDDSGAISSDVSFTLNETDQGVVLTVEADAQWINAEDRVFPVKIDPTFIIDSGSALDDIYSVYTMEAAPNDTTLGRQYLYVGAQPYSTSNDGRYRLFMHFNDLPDIPAGSEVVAANLNLYQFQYIQRYCPSFPVGVYEVTTGLPSSYSSYFDWFAAMTWRNNMPSYDTSNCIDYVMVDSTKGYRTWNMTELVKKWYAENTDNATAALVMMNEDAIDTYYYFASVAFYAYASTIPPMLMVSYRNNTGIEPYYTYATLGGANAGTAYIADATGQLKVGKELLSYASSTNPFTLNLIYNSDYFSQAPGSDYLPPNKLGLSMNVGSGWTLDCIQKVEEENINNIDYLKYTDGDGTIHYFMKDSSPDDSNYPYYDEDGLGLKMKINSTGNYTMADDKGNEWTFTGHYLTTIKDSDGNKININYANGRLSSIAQVNNGKTAITVANFTYTDSALTGLTDAAGNTYTLTYSGGKLASIQKNNVTIASYTYDGYRVTKMTDSESGYGLSFEYANGKVSKYYENTSAGNGAVVAVTYPSHSQTTYRDYGADRTANTADDILTHYLFDYAQRTANAYTTDNAGNILGATNAVYSGTGSTDKTNNRTLRSASIGVAGQQLMRDTSLEFSNSAWTPNGTSISTSNARTGTHSIEGTLSSNGTQSAYISSESLVAGNTYSFSGYVNTSDVTAFEGQGISLRVSDGNYNWRSAPINYTTSDLVDGGWVQISVYFTAEISSAHTLFIENDGAIGTFYADDFQLERGDAPSSYNILENGGMELSNHGWTMGTGAAYSSAKGAAASSTSIKITGNPEDNTTNAYQDVVLNQPGTQTYVLSGWVNANAVPDDDSNEEKDLNNTTKECGLRATITYSDNSTEVHYAPFNTDLSNTWQFVSLTVVPKKPTQTVSKIRVACAYEGNANEAYFDNISLVREAAQTMRYDEDGNLISVESPGLDEDVDTYSGGNLIKTVTGGYGTYKYTYDSTYKHRLTSVTNDLITQTLAYDGAGNVTSTTLSGTGGKSISTSAEYDESGNRLTSVTDATGAEVAYAYSNVNSQMMSLPTAVTDANGTVVTSSYDENYRVTETGIENIANISYTYSNGNLASVARTDDSDATQTYSFTYDSFGNMLTLKVGNRTLATYTYNGQNGLLSQQTYGNGDTVSYTYDNLGRTKTVTFADNRVMTYTYNGEGRLHSVVETGGDSTVTYLYTYDSIGRLISSEQRNGDNSVLRTHQTYNESNQLTGQSWQLGNSAYSESYTYNSEDGSLNTMTTASGDTLTMGYDGLRRLSTVTGGPFNRSYAYRDISDTQTALQVSSFSYPNLGSGLSFGYTYDDLGNIATYAAPGNSAVSYTYDIQGQLLKAEGDETYTYTYDSVGNILTASDGTDTHTYAYGDANWKDLLTSYDGETITYDDSGNPISYYNGTRWAFTWGNGQRLTRAVSTGASVDFTYNLEGLRTSKTVGGVTHNYFYAGGKLLRESDGTNTLDFVYDANEKPYAMIHTVGSESPTTTTYYYVTNLQGDVVKLVDAEGTTVVSYEYDPYGRTLSASGTLAELNPLRYRGYVYDHETGLYYLESRYYDPATGRFLNADSYASTGKDFIGYNMYAYCNNNPVAYCDSSGEILVGAIIGGAIGGGLLSVVSHLTTNPDATVGSTLLALVVGAGTGALGGAAGILSASKGVFSVGVGIATAIYTFATTSGSWGQKVGAGVSAGLFSGVGTFLGAGIYTIGPDRFATGAINYFTTVFVGSFIEPISVAVQNHITSWSGEKQQTQSRTPVQQQKWNVSKESKYHLLFN